MNKTDILEALIPYFEKDEKLFLLICDYGFGAIDSIKNRFPDRVLNVGIREQATIGIAAGMAMAGMKPIVFGMINFLVFRALEQIRNDIMLQKQNVKIIAVGAGDYFRFLGPSHTCGTDDVDILQIIGLKYYTDSQFVTWITSDEAGYLRI